jgi:hypothetical protein
MVDLRHKNFYYGRKDVYSPSPQVSLIRKEFVALTGNPHLALVLNQLLRWTHLDENFRMYLAEELKAKNGYTGYRYYGWMRKSLVELKEETMLKVAPATLRRYLRSLVKQGWIKERILSFKGWGRVIQYRVNLGRIQEGLFELGYTLPKEFSKIASGSLWISTSMQISRPISRCW